MPSARPLALVDARLTVEQLPYNTRSHEAEVVAEVLRLNAGRKRGGIAIGTLLPAVLARLDIQTKTEVPEPENRRTETEITEVRDRS